MIIATVLINQQNIASKDNMTPPSILTITRRLRNHEAVFDLLFVSKNNLLYCISIDLHKFFMQKINMSSTRIRDRRCRCMLANIDLVVLIEICPFITLCYSNHLPRLTKIVACSGWQWNQVWSWKMRANHCFWIFSMKTKF